VYGIGHFGFVGVLRLPGSNWSKKGVLLAALLCAGICSANSGRAETPRPSLADVEDMLPRQPPGYKMPYYRWSDGAPISVTIITDGQRGPCIDAALPGVQGQIDLIRRDVPPLAKIRDARLADWVPAEKQEAPLLIALPMENRRIETALAQYGHLKDSGATVVEVNKSLGMSVGLRGPNDPPDAQPVYSIDSEDAFRIERGRIAYAQSYTVHLRGLSLYRVERCSETARWGYGLYSLLGVESFFPEWARNWLRGAPEAELRRWYGHAYRMFLIALHSCPGTPATRECLVRSLYDLLNDPGRGPRD
jgi:hypothetical protein